MNVHGKSALLAFVCLALTGMAGHVDAASGGARSFRVTIENLTPQRGGGAAQVLSPPLVLVHTSRVRLFTVGQPANQAVIDVAEDAIATTGITRYTGDPEVESVAAYGGPIPPGQKLEFEVTARGNANQLSLVTMLVNTNDGFTGLDAVHLGGDARTYWTVAYDAGSERNDQLKASIPGPCCGDTGRHGTDEHGVIAPHAGIVAGVGELYPAVWGWPPGPVAKITVARVK